MSKHISGFRMIEIAPRALQEDGSGYFCFRCKIDLGKVEGGPVNNVLFKNVCKHWHIHCNEMREMI